MPFPPCSFRLISIKMSSLSERLAAISEVLDSGREENLRVAECEDDGLTIVDGRAGEAGSEGKVRKRRVDFGGADEAEEENEDERLRNMKGRSRRVSRFSKDGEDVAGEDGEDVVYGGAGRVSKQAVDNMVNELEAVEKRRSKYRRRRTFDEDRADITFINEGNRVFNRTLDKHFDKYESVKEIKDNLERGTA